MNEAQKKRFRSRTWWLTVYWSLMVPVGFVVQTLVDFEMPLSALVSLAGVVTGAYIGKRAVQVKKGVNG